MSIREQIMDGMKHYADRLRLVVGCLDRAYAYMECREYYKAADELNKICSYNVVDYYDRWYNDVFELAKKEK